jgi:hypothetical protein
MSIRMLVLGAVVLVAAGQLACSTQANAAQATSSETSNDGGLSPPPGEGQFCGGIAGFPCPPGLECVDDPNDDCDPNQGGADCGGICVRQQPPPKPPRCDRHDPRLSYVSRDPEQCMAIRFMCPDGATPFFNECGCGCRTLVTECDYSDPTRFYVSTDPGECAVLLFVCGPAETTFFDSCGCGCSTAAP